MIVIDEARVATLLTDDMLERSSSAALIAAADGTGVLNPVVIGRGFGDGETFSIKSGGAEPHGALGLKVGAYWPGNPRHGLMRHASSIILIDQNTGRVEAIVEAGALNGARTAAVNAHASAALARRDSRVLGVIGAGNQAKHEIKALVRVLPIERVLIASRSIASAATLCAEMSVPGGPILVPVGSEEACRGADILTTVTSSRVPLFDDNWIRPGTHISSMGSDQRGKQELPTSLLKRAALFCDHFAQSLAVGEFQHVSEEVLAGRIRLTSIGNVLLHREPGRSSDTEITIFDSSGIALQDLILAAQLLDAERQSGGPARA